MAIICLLFIPNTFNTICAMATIFSINVGVFGFLVHWDVALDPVSMTSLLMSIGYSVDFTSHISYHYYISVGKSQKVIDSSLPFYKIYLSVYFSATSLSYVFKLFCFAPYLTYIFLPYIS